MVRKFTKEIFLLTREKLLAGIAGLPPPFPGIKISFIVNRLLDRAYLSRYF